MSSRPFPVLRALALLAAAGTLFACTRTVTVTVPPRIDLRAYPTIAVIDFASRPPGELGADATQKYLGNLQSAQPGVRLLELGSQAQVLREVGRTELDHQAVRAIGERYGVAAVLSGTVELSEPRPDLDIGRDLTSLTARAKVDGRMNAKLWEAASGATVWTNSSWGSWSVAGLRVDAAGATDAGFQHPQEQRERILMSLIKALNGDFWPTYERRKVAD